MAQIAAGLMDIAAARLEAVLAARQPALAPPERPVAARVAMTSVMALLAMATAEKPRGEAHVTALLAEARQLLAAYLATLDTRAAGNL